MQQLDQALAKTVRAQLASVVPDGVLDTATDAVVAALSRRVAQLSAALDKDQEQCWQLTLAR